MDTFSLVMDNVFIIAGKIVTMDFRNSTLSVGGDNFLNDSNYTYTNRSSHNLMEGAGHDEIFTSSSSRWRHIFTICELPFTVCCISVALNIVLRCRKMSFSARFLSVMVLIAFLSYAVINIIFSTIVLFGPTEYHRKLFFDHQACISTVFLSILWSSMCVLTLERFVAIVYPFHYINVVTKRTVYTTVCLTWAFNIIVPSVLVIISWVNVCGHDGNTFTCDIFEILKPLRMFAAVILCISFITTIAVYCRIFIKIRQHKREIKALIANSSGNAENDDNSQAFNTTILIIVFSFLVLQFPYVVMCTMFEIKPHLKHQKWRVYLQTTCYICHELDTFVTLYLYIWRFPECRMHLYNILSKVNRKYRQKAEALRMDVFNVVAFEKSNHVSTSEICF